MLKQCLAVAEVPGLKGRNAAVFLLIFAFPGNSSILDAQICAGNRRKPQRFAETPLSHAVCPFQFRPRGGTKINVFVLKSTLSGEDVYDRKGS